MWLFRHGETEWNRLGRLQGRDDSPLTELGAAQASALAAFAHARRIERLLVSPAGRAQATAARIAAVCGARLETHEALAEMSFGTCAGLTVPEVEARWPGLSEERERSRWRHRWPGGESYADVLERLAAWRHELGLVLPAPGLAVVAHQSLNRALAVLLAPCAPEQAMALRQGSSTVLHLEGGGVITSHEARGRRATSSRPGVGGAAPDLGRHSRPCRSTGAVSKEDAQHAGLPGGLRVDVQPAEELEVPSIRRPPEPGCRGPG